MKKLVHKSLWYGVYFALYASLWYTFFNGVNIYMDRFQDLMTGLYIMTNSLFLFLVVCMWVINAVINKDTKLKQSMKEFVDSAKSQDFINMAERHKSWSQILYRYLTFYPAIFCAGILLGYYQLMVAMLIDVVSVMLLKSQIETLKQNVKN